MHHRIIPEALAALALVSVSCVSEQEAPLAPSALHTFSVEAELPQIEQEDFTKGSLGSYISATWKEGDKVSVVNLTTGRILGGDLVADRDGTVARFNGTVSGTVTPGDSIAVVYPSLGAAQEEDFGTRKISLASQTKSDGVPLAAYSLFRAGSGEGTLDVAGSFYYMISYIKINMAGLPATTPVSKIILKNFPSEFSLSADRTGLVIGTPEERAANGRIELQGDFLTSGNGYLTAAAGVMPSDTCANRILLLKTEDGQTCVAKMVPTQLGAHRYYNTIVADFDRLNTESDEYGVYDAFGSRIDPGDSRLDANLIYGEENGESDFSLVNTVRGTYWTVRGIPADALDGTDFIARLYSYGIDGLEQSAESPASVLLTDNDGDALKLWVRIGDNIHIVRK